MGPPSGFSSSHSEDKWRPRRQPDPGTEWDLAPGNSNTHVDVHSAPSDSDQGPHEAVGRARPETHPRPALTRPRSGRLLLQGCALPHPPGQGPGSASAQTTHKRLSVRGHSLTFTSPNGCGQGLKEMEGEEGIQTEAKSYTLNVLGWAGQRFVCD